jgi:hypothetical protein
MSHHNIYNIAKHTRKELEILIKKFFNPDWSCSCAVCSWQLTRVLKQFNYDAIFVVGKYLQKNYYYPNEHAFVIVDSQIIDITGTQFNLDEIEIKRFDDKHYVVDFLGRSAVKDLFNWPKEQQPITYKKYLDKALTKTIQKLK